MWTMFFVDGHRSPSLGSLRGGGCQRGRRCRSRCRRSPGMKVFGRVDFLCSRPLECHCLYTYPSTAQSEKPRYRDPQIRACLVQSSPPSYRTTSSRVSPSTLCMYLAPFAVRPTGHDVHVWYSLRVALAHVCVVSRVDFVLYEGDGKEEEETRMGRVGNGEKWYHYRSERRKSSMNADMLMLGLLGGTMGLRRHLVRVVYRGLLSVLCHLAVS